MFAFINKHERSTNFIFYVYLIWSKKLNKAKPVAPPCKFILEQN